jgi:hypothetical protein
MPGLRGDGARGVRGMAVDQVVRLHAFRERYPHVVIGTLGLGGAWQGRVPEENGEIVVTRYELRDLLDKLIDLLGEPGSETS